MAEIGEILNSTTINPDTLRHPKAKEVACLLRAGVMNWARFVECRRFEVPILDEDAERLDLEIVFLDVDVELPQRRIYDIRREERIAAIFWPDDLQFPETLALREDFPLVPHLNLRRVEYPRSLCLFDEPYEEVKLQWTPLLFIERIRTWLARTARGTLHEDDQALEPLLMGSLTPIVIPYDLFSGIEGQISERLIIWRKGSSEGRYIVVAERAEKAPKSVLEQKSPQFIALAIEGCPQAHGIIHKEPANLKELHQFLESAGVDLLSFLRSNLREWQQDKSALNALLIIIVALPKTRRDQGTVEATDVWAFVCGRASEDFDEGFAICPRNENETALSVLDIGERLGVWEVRSGEPGMIIGGDSSKQGNEVGVALLNPVFTLSGEKAALLNGQPSRHYTKIVAVGMGALGSQIFLNLARAAYGEWTLIDKDYLLPHNPPRHALFGSMIGWPKVLPLADLANSTIDGPPIAATIVADILHPGEKVEQVKTSLSEAKYIFDFSASVAVARHLSHVESKARRISVFLNPSGSDLVLLSEDAKRNIPLTLLEMQYYRSLTNEPTLHDHLRSADGRLRYAHSCRDLTSVIPQEYVALHAATASRALRRALANDTASIAIWRVNDEDGSLIALNLSTSPVVVKRIGDWTLYTDEHLLKKVRQFRTEKLPNETGGALIGSFDTERKIAYVIDTLPAPPDSQESRKYFIRGAQRLSESFENIAKITHGNLRHVGEWHSHPCGYSNSPSNDDYNLFTWLRENMWAEGLPPLILIVSDEQHEWHLDTLLK
jgi:E2/UBC family protein A/JAB domain-containing protein similar to deubiquitination enzymes/ThiF family protein